MTGDHDARISIAQAIAEAENRVSQLRDRVTRLTGEGSDASQAQETLRTVSCSLGNLYIQQSIVRQLALDTRSAKVD
jgi:hypothetical protein